MFKLSPQRIWGMAISLFVLDFILIYAFFNQPTMMGATTSAWDFRIEELRQLDTPQPRTGVAGVSMRRDSLEPKPTIITQPIPAITPPLDREVDEVSPRQLWQMPFGSTNGQQGTSERDANGQIL